MEGSSSIIFLVLFLLIMYFMLIRPQKKREKQTENMRSSVKVGDEIITIGGICGKVVKAKDDVIVIQTGSDKLKIEMMRWSISKVVVQGAESKKAAEEAASQEPAKKVMPKRMGKKKAEEEAVEPAVEVVEAAPEVVDAVPAEAVEAEPAKEN